ncbi:hypothetical protein ACFLW6_04760 [Chloroflexota bacterium]
MLGLPFDTFRALWERYIHCPLQSIIEFDFALTSFKHDIEELFGVFIGGYRELAYFPAELRNPIMDAGSDMKLLKIVYEGIKRIVEPYSLKKKYVKMDSDKNTFMLLTEQGEGVGLG